MKEKIKTISILGPTASGKTALAVELAKLTDGEIVSCDSMQIYRGMEIGTAAPTPEETQGIPHHLVGIIDPQTEFSAGEYVTLAKKAIADIASRGKLPIICGGTGLYHDALMKLPSFTGTPTADDVKPDEELRKSLYAYAEANGNEALHAKLRQLDPDSAEKIHPNNVKRVVRAIEICRITGRTKTEIDAEQYSGESDYDDTVFILTFADRALLYSRINKRVEQMLENGLENEAKRIVCSVEGQPSRTSFQAIGYKEFIPYFNKEASLDEVKAQIQLATRHYAKRQMIWFRRDKTVNILIPDEHGELKAPLELALEIVKKAELRVEKSPFSDNT